MIEHIAVKGYRLFRDFETDLQPGINVLIGANGSGKSSLVEFLRIVQSCASGPIRPGIERRGARGVVFHPQALFDNMFWQVDFVLPEATRTGEEPVRCYAYRMQIEGAAPPVILTEQLRGALGREDLASGKGQVLFQAVDGRGEMLEGQVEGQLPIEWHLEPGEPMLSRATDPTRRHCSWARDYLLKWRFYTDLQVSRVAPLRQPQALGGRTALEETGENLGSVLLSLFTNLAYREQRDELVSFLHSAIPEFEALTPTPDDTGKYVVLQWREQGLDTTLSAADLSDGVLRLLALGVICCNPFPPPLICLDEPEIGLHPKLLPLVGGLLQHASDRSQVIVLTHSPDLLYDMPLENIAVMRKRDGEAQIVWPKDHDILADLLTEEVAGERQVDRDRLRDAMISGEMDELG